MFKWLYKKGDYDQSDRRIETVELMLMHCYTFDQVDHILNVAEALPDFDKARLKYSHLLVEIGLRRKEIRELVIRARQRQHIITGEQILKQHNLI